MKYINSIQDFRDLMKPGDITFSMNHGNPISEIMSKFMRSKWSHSILFLEQTVNRLYSLETSDFEVWINDFTQYLEPQYEIEIWEPIDDSIRQDAVRDGYKHRGDTYGYLQLMGFALRCTLQRFGIEFLNPIRMGIVCCGVIFYAYQGKNIKGMDDQHPESRHTQDLYEIIKSSGQFRLKAIKVYGYDAR